MAAGMKKFIIIGNGNAASCKEIFPLIKNNQLWLGNNKITDFNTGAGEIKGVYATWYSTFPVTRKPLILTATYSPDKYPVYDNYIAINVDKVCDIPMDYDGVMGVPISFLDKYCPEQFEILGLMSGARGEGLINGNDGRVKFYVSSASATLK